MGVCAPDMNSCTPKCKVCTGPNAGKAYNCSDPCSCYNTPNYSPYSWNGTDCVTTGGPCAPLNGTNCTGTIGVYFGIKIRTENTGPADASTNISDTTGPAYNMIGTQSGPFYNNNTYYKGIIASGPMPSIQYSWVWNLPTKIPVYAYGGTSYLINNFGGTAQIGIFPYLPGGYIDTFGFQGVGRPFCSLPCCGCTPCSEYWGCPGLTNATGSPAGEGELYGKIKVDLLDMVVIVRWISGPNESTSYWTRIG